MNPVDAGAKRKWLAAQVREYKEQFPRYAGYAAVLERALRKAAKDLAPLAIVQVRPKAIASFAEKALRKPTKDGDPVREFTDLCGARVICRTRREVEAVGAFIKGRFEIDWENSVDATARLQPAEFGYRSTHYIVSLKGGADLDVKVPASLYGLKAEVQVRTTAEHAWADFAHDLSYKSAFELPAKIRRDVAVIAAELEDVDHAFTRIENELRTFAATYGAYMDDDRIHEEIETLETVLSYDRSNAKLAWRIGKLRMTLGDWRAAVAVFSRHVDARRPDEAYQPLLRDLGIALCKLHRNDPRGRAYRRGQRYLELAGAPPHKDSDALASLAGTWRGIDEKQARELYRRAFELDRTDFYPLGNFIEYEIRRTKDASSLQLLGPVIADALERCRAQAAVGINLPWVYYGIAKFHLLLGEPYESLRAYAKAIQASTAPFMIDGALESLDKLSVISEDVPGFEWARRLLLLGKAAKFPSPGLRRRLRALSGDKRREIRAPVVIVVGGTDPSIEKKMKSYRTLLQEAFSDFQGTVISGGTRQGVSGLVGEVGKRSGGRIRTLGYLPRRMPRDATVDRRYGEIRRTDSGEFSPLEPLQNWIDILLSGIDPRNVKVLGINGGTIAASEYRIALALGATVGVIEETGREAAKLLTDEAWAVADTLVPMPADAQTVRAFIGSGKTQLAPTDREALAEAIHDRYRRQRAASPRSDDPSMADWGALAPNLQESNRQQADHISAKLRQIGCSVSPVTGRPIVIEKLRKREIETMAEMEHGRWNAERMADGWRWGERRDVAAKISPYLVRWSELPDEIKAYDRETVAKIPEFLAAVGLEVRREA